jgi:hypothetical protein
MKLTLKKNKNGGWIGSINRFNGGVSTLIRSRSGGGFLWALSVFFLFKEYKRCLDWEKKYPKPLNSNKNK